MKTHLLFLVVSCLFFLSVTGYTQPRQPTAEERRQLRIEEIKYSLRLNWDSHTSIISVINQIHYKDIRLALGISDEQVEQEQAASRRDPDVMRTTLENRPEYLEMFRALFEESEVLYERYPDARPRRDAGGLLPGAPMPAEFYEQSRDINKRMSRLQTFVTAEAYRGILTSEQEQKICEAMLANMEIYSIISPSWFVGLDLMDVQKQQMQTLAEDFEPELEKYLENFANYWVAHDELLFATLEKQEGATLGERMQATNKILAGNPEYKRITEEWGSLKKAFAAQFMEKISERNIFTGEQWARLQELFDNPPEHAKALVRGIRGMGVAAAASGGESVGSGDGEKSDGWQPGPGSWRPGDALPVRVQEQREGRFPRGEE